MPWETQSNGSGDSRGGYIIGTTQHQMESIMAGTADQAKAETGPAQAAIASGRPKTPAGVPQVQKGETQQVD